VVRPLFSKARKIRRDSAGFTLVELIVVVAIIATLASVVGPAVFRNAGDAKAGAARAQIEAYALALNAYRLDTDAFPTTEEGLAILREPPSSATAWRGPYVTKAIAPDPWGRPYVYLGPGRQNLTSFDLYSLGRDGRVGGTGEDADVTSWGGPVDP
jgi:general secretion pathway protein G